MRHRLPRRLAVSLLIPVLISGCSLSHLQSSLFPFFRDPGRPMGKDEPPPAVPPGRTLPPPKQTGPSALPVAVQPPQAQIAVAPSAPSAQTSGHAPADNGAPSSPPASGPSLPPRVRQPLPPATFSYTGNVLTEDVSWHGDVLVDGSVTVAPQATLTVEPGTVVRFRSNGGQAAILVVQGRLSAQGTQDLPVRFTSEFADVRPGDWQGLLLLASEKNNLLENCRIEGAETGLGANYSRVVLKSTTFASCRTGAYFDNAFATISGGGSRKCTLGLKASNSEMTLYDADISGNGTGFTAEDSSVSLERSSLLGNENEAVLLEGGRFRIHRNSIANNGSGLRLYGTEGGVTANRILNNGGIGIDASGANLRISGNVIADNAGVGVRVEEGNVTAWDNSVSGNREHDLYNGGAQVTAVGNWWGTASAEAIAGRIGGAGRTAFLPALQSPPSVAR